MPAYPELLGGQWIISLCINRVRDSAGRAVTCESETVIHSPI